MATSWTAGRVERITIACHFLHRRQKCWITILALQMLLRKGEKVIKIEIGKWNKKNNKKYLLESNK